MQDIFLVFFLIGSSFCYAFGFKVVESIEGEAYYNKKKSKKISEKVLPRNDEKKLKMIYDSIISNMVECPAGSFIMGSPENELGRATRREKQHKEIIAIPFYIGKYEVTQNLYETITGDNPSTFFQEKDDEEKPVENISWDDAVEFCEILNSVFKDFLPKGYRFDLPTQIDCRSRSLENVDKVLDEVRKSLDASCTQNLGLSYEIKEKISMKEVPMNENIKKLMEREADNAGISTRRMLSGAAHDAMVMGSICDVAMIFVPSHEGRSHVPEEWTDYKDIQKGTELLYRTVKNLASE